MEALEKLMSHKTFSQSGKQSGEGDFPEDVLSEELFREIAQDLLVPVSAGLDAETQCQLYLSKLLYLDHIRRRAFSALNSIKETPSSNFTSSDLEILKEATLLTQSELKIQLKRNLENALAVADQKGWYAS
jgi:hypothetical protein